MLRLLLIWWNFGTSSFRGNLLDVPFFSLSFFVSRWNRRIDQINWITFVFLSCCGYCFSLVSRLSPTVSSFVFIEILLQFSLFQWTYRSEIVKMSIGARILNNGWQLAGKEKRYEPKRINKAINIELITAGRTYFSGGWFHADELKVEDLRSMMRNQRRVSFCLEDNVTIIFEHEGKVALKLVPLTLKYICIWREFIFNIFHNFYFKCQEHNNIVSPICSRTDLYR